VDPGIFQKGDEAGIRGTSVPQKLKQNVKLLYNILTICENLGLNE